MRGEKVGLGRSGDRLLCPCLATARRIIHLRTHQLLHPSTTIHTYQGLSRPIQLRSSSITDLIRQSVAILGERLGLQVSEVSTKSLRASGAMALLCARVDPDTVQLLGRWRSDAMVRYLHVQAEPLVSHLANQMFDAGQFSFRPSQL